MRGTARQSGLRAPLQVRVADITAGSGCAEPGSRSGSARSLAARSVPTPVLDSSPGRRPRELGGVVGGAEFSKAARRLRACGILKWKGFPVTHLRGEA